MRRDTDTNSELQKLGRALCDNVLRGLSGYTEEGKDELSELLTRTLVNEDSYIPSPGIHPSSLGGCKRKMFYVLVGAKSVPMVPDPSLKLKLEVSKKLHDLIQDKLSRLDLGRLYLEHEKHIPDDSEARICYGIRGRCDTLVSNEYAPLLILDYKFIEDAAFNRLSSPDNRYIRQNTAYMYSFNCGRSLIIYFNKKYLTEKKIYEVPFDANIWYSIAEEISEVRDMADKEILPNRSVDFFVCRNMCNYIKLCEPPLRSRL